jgi:hypothetical protein
VDFGFIKEMLGKGNEDASLNTSVSKRKKVHIKFPLFSTSFSPKVELTTYYPHTL